MRGSWVAEKKKLEGQSRIMRRGAQECLAVVLYPDPYPISNSSASL